MPKKQDLSNELRLLYHRYFEKTEVVLAHKQHNIVLAGVPIHNNLGDQAIVLAEKNFWMIFFRLAMLLLSRKAMCKIL